MKSSLPENPDIETILPVCCVPAIRATRILLFEFIASGIVTFSIMVSYSESAPFGSPNQCGFTALGMFFAFVISGQLSGGHANPIITLALLFTKGSNVTPLGSVIYIIAQYMGSVVGAAIAYATVAYFGCPFTTPVYDQGEVFALEFLGSFLFITIYLFIMSASTKVENNFWSYFMVPFAYYISNMLTNQFIGLNPASTFANQLFLSIRMKNFQFLSIYWAYIIAPVVGSILSSLLFNYFTLPAYRAIHSAMKK